MYYTLNLIKEKAHILCLLYSDFRVTVAILALLGHLDQKVKDILDQWWVY